MNGNNTDQKKNTKLKIKGYIYIIINHDITIITKQRVDTIDSNSEKLLKSTSTTNHI